MTERRQEKAKLCQKTKSLVWSTCRTQVCVDRSCHWDLSGNDSRKVSCGYFVKCLEHDIKDVDLILCGTGCVKFWVRQSVAALIPSAPVTAYLSHPV